MDNVGLIFSYIYMFFIGIYLLIGLYIIIANPKDVINRVGLGLIIALCFWTLGFMFSVSAPNYEIALFWRRIAVIGWGTIFSLILHASLIMTKREKILKKWWIYILIYLPAFITIYYFGISNTYLSELYHLELTPWGWINYPKASIFDFLYHIYYSVFFSISFILFGLWGIKAKDKKTKEQAMYICLILGTIFLFKIIMNNVVTQEVTLIVSLIVPILLIFPMLGLFMFVNKFELMKCTPNEKDLNQIDQISRKKIYFYLSVTSVVVGIANFEMNYIFFKEREFTDVLFFSIIIFLFAISIHIVQQFNLIDDHKDSICAIFVAIMIPVLSIYYFDYGNNDIWAFPFILLLAYLIFRKRIYLLFIAASIMVTQLIIFIVSFDILIEIHAIYFFTRILLFIIAIVLALYLNKVYLLRLKQNNEKIRLQKMIAKISKNCVKINQENFKTEMALILDDCSKFFLVKQGKVYFSKPDKKKYTCFVEYSNIKSELLIERLNAQVLENRDIKIKSISNNKIYQAEIYNIEGPMIKNRRMQKKRDNEFYQIMIPISRNEKVIGFFEFISEIHESVWKENDINAIKIIANLIGETISRIESEKEINILAYYDQVTNLPNRVLFKREVLENIERLKGTDIKMGLMFVDLDSFKIVNETVGHGVGDELLSIVGRKLQNVIGKNNSVSRFSGDKFTIMIRSYSSFSEIITIANKIMDLFYEPFFLKEQAFFMSASSGIAIYPKDGEDAETLIMNADIAKYEAKELGRNQYLFCSTRMKNEINEKNEIINNLYRALEKNELFLVFQPQVSIETGKIIGIESLVRWKNSELGLISPTQFIPLAEQTGLINPIGDWILETAMRQIKKWYDMGINDVHMAVNISPVQLKNPQFTLEFEKVLTKVGLKPELLEIEITETFAIYNFKEIIAILNNFKALGIAISIDDFGSGYSSLGRIKKLPVDCLKIDKQFIDEISENRKDQAIGEAIIQFAKSLGSHVIAEGVENEAQYQFLKKAKCDYIQGYYFYEPMLAKDLEVILKEQNNLL